MVIPTYSDPVSVEDRVRIEINKYDWDIELVTAIFLAESGLNPNAYNPEWHKNCQGSIGVAQVACIHYPENPTALYDYKFNIEIAYNLYSKYGWKIWGSYTDKRYLQYLK